MRGARLDCFDIDLGKLLRVTRLSSSHFVPPQTHCTRYTNEYILYVVASGELHLQVGEDEMHLAKGDVVLFEQGVFQKPLFSTECEFYYLHFKTDHILKRSVSEKEYYEEILARKAGFLKADIFSDCGYDYIRALLPARMHIEKEEELAHAIRIFKNNTVSYGRNLPAWRINVSSASAELLMLLEEMVFSSVAHGYVTRNGGVYENVKRITHYVEANFKENFGSAEIERDLLINFDYANRIFKAHVGESIIRYRNHLRINTAKTMLDGKSGKMLDEIAKAVGFRSVYYFSRYFKQTVGVSPLEYCEKARRFAPETEEET
jgi:YesN/AraC family two-component response regulator